MNRKILILSLAFSILLFLLLSIFTVYQLITTYDAHSTFEGYCHWRGLEVVNQSADFGYCSNPSGQIYKIVLFNGRWYLNGDLPNEWPF